MKLPFKLFERNAARGLVPSAVLLRFLRDNELPSGPFTSIPSGSHGDPEWVNRVWAAFAIGICTLCSPGILKGNTYERTEFSKGIFVLMRWIARTWAFCGPEFLSPRVKNIFDWIRYYSMDPIAESPRPECLQGVLGGTRSGFLTFPWIKGWARHFVGRTVGPLKDLTWSVKVCKSMTLLYQKRALPLPTQKLIYEAAISHRELVTKWIKPPSSFAISKIADYVEDFLKDKTPSKSAIHSSPGSGACMERSRSKGGRGVMIKEEIERRCGFVGPHYSSLDPEKPYYDAIGDQKAFPGSIYGCAEVLTCYVKDMDQAFDYNRMILFLSIDRLVESGVIPKEWLPTPDFGPDLTTGFFENEIPIWNLPPVGPNLVRFSTKAAVISDQGIKTRIVQVAPWAVVQLLHFLRTCLYSALRKDPECKGLYKKPQVNSAIDPAPSGSEIMHAINFAEGTPEEMAPSADFLRCLLPEDRAVWLSEEKWIIDSLDLSKATDTILHEAIAETFQGINRSWGSQSGFGAVIRLCCIVAMGECSIDYSAVSEVEVPIQTQRRGISMGNPATWAILNLLVRFCKDFALQIPTMDREKRLREKEACFAKMFRVRSTTISWIDRKGDDNITPTKVGPALRFRRVLSYVGFIPSPGTDILSERVGTFAESCFLFSINDGEKGRDRCQYVDIFRGKTLNKSTNSNAGPRAKELPSWVTIGDALSKMIEWLDPRPKRTLRLLIHWMLSEELTKAKAVGLPVFLPRSVGGLGYPEPRGNPLGRTDARTLKALSILMLSADVPQNVFKMMSLDPGFIISDNSPWLKQVEGLLDQTVTALTPMASVNGPVFEVLPTVSRISTMKTQVENIEDAIGSATNASSMFLFHWLKARREFEYRWAGWMSPGNMMSDHRSVDDVGRRFKSKIAKINVMAGGLLWTREKHGIDRNLPVSQLEKLWYQAMRTIIIHPSRIDETSVVISKPSLSITL
jgi:hypothetical protein